MKPKRRLTDWWTKWAGFEDDSDALMQSVPRKEGNIELMEVERRLCLSLFLSLHPIHIFVDYG